MDIKTKELILNEVNNNPTIISMYDYGSVVYGTLSDKSDHDIIMVVDNNFTQLSEFVLSHLDVNIFTEEQFKEMLLNHEITAIECISLNKEHVWKDKGNWEFNLNIPQLRNAFSAKSSNSWVKAKKKFIVEKDYNPYIGLKSAWHAIRILEFGNQVADNGKVIDFTVSNHLLPAIKECSSWEELDGKFRTVYNAASSAFKLKAPKEVVPPKKLVI